MQGPGTKGDKRTMQSKGAAAEPKKHRTPSSPQAPKTNQVSPGKSLGAKLAQGGAVNSPAQNLGQATPVTLQLPSRDLSGTPKHPFVQVSSKNKVNKTRTEDGKAHVDSTASQQANLSWNLAANPFHTLAGVFEVEMTEENEELEEPQCEPAGESPASKTAPVYDKYPEKTTSSEVETGNQLGLVSSDISLGNGAPNPNRDFMAESNRLIQEALNMAEAARSIFNPGVAGKEAENAASTVWTDVNDDSEPEEQRAQRERDAEVENLAEQDDPSEEENEVSLDNSAELLTTGARSKNDPGSGDEVAQMKQREVVGKDKEAGKESNGQNSSPPGNWQSWQEDTELSDSSGEK
ncbi:hypothetical protein R1sor_012292 [Riccia sorocarpa]|uniref:Uncharacterized protein n=1 Tax=Riccia sorocarpa TaxID=122646 RepID=A0ABD3I7I3_9MARC